MRRKPNSLPALLAPCVWFALLTFVLHPSPQAEPLHLTPTIPAHQAKSTLARLEHYLQWGLFDSLYQVSDSWLNHPSITAQIPSPEATTTQALYHLYRGAALFTRKDMGAARKDFTFAACLEPKAALDSFYLPPAMSHLQDSLKTQVAAGMLACDFSVLPPLPVNVSTSTDSITSTTTTTSGPSPTQSNRAASSAWSGAGWVLGGVAMVAAGWGAYAWQKQNAAFDAQAQAGLTGNRTEYDKLGSEIKTHFRTRNTAFATALVAAAGSGLCFYWNRKTLRHSITLSPHLEGLEVACTF